MAGLKVITPPAIEPVTWQEVASQLRYDDPDAEVKKVFEDLITGAREWCEGYQNRAYMLQTLELALDAWPEQGVIELPRPQLRSVTSITYVNSNGNAMVLDPANYIVDDYSVVGRIVANGSWPATKRQPNAIKVKYVAGAEEAKEVPQRVKQAIILLVNVWFDTPGAEPPDAVKNLLSLDRVMPV